MKFIYCIFLFITATGYSQQLLVADFKSLNANILIDYEKKAISGNLIYKFDVLMPADTIRIDAINMEFRNVKINGNAVESKTTKKHLLLYKGYRKGKNTLSFDYSALPKQTMYFVGSGDQRQVWTQGQGKYTSHWLPSFDDMNEKVIFNLSITYDKGFEVISNGMLTGKSETGNQVTWNHQMQKPMSSYLVMIAAGKFLSTTEKAASGTPLVMYYQTQDQQKFEPTYRYSKKMFDALENEIGVKYPWEIYKQVPVLDFLYAGMENTTATVFAQDFVVDSTGFTDRNYVNVNAHELAHQWFGDMVTAKSGKHHWLQEGFATYYALLAEKEVLGDDHFTWKLYEMAENLQRAATSDTVPVMNEKASSLSFYQKGAWALHALHDQTGPEAFRKGVKSYLEKYAFQNVDTDMFLNELGRFTKADLKKFKKEWLETSGFRVDEAILILKKNAFMKKYFEVLDVESQPFQAKVSLFNEILGSAMYHPVKEEVIYQTSDLKWEEKRELIRKAMASSDVKVRQAVAKSLREIPGDFYDEYFTLLSDRSYITKEIATAALWKQFPDKRKQVLDAMQGQTGFNDKNLRIQWLTLALLTSDYNPAEKVNYYDELLSYTSNVYESTVRQNAIESLLFAGKNDKNVLAALINPLMHHKWQFSKFARDKIRELIKSVNYRQYFSDQLEQLPEGEKIQLSRLLAEKI